MTATDIDAVVDRYLDGVDLAVADWERDGHLPPTFFRDLAKTGYLRDRWRDGATTGLPLATAMARRLGPLSGGVALALSVHSEVFMMALRLMGRSRYAEELFEGALDGEVIGCLAATEDGGGSDLRGAQTRAVRTETGWMVRGRKRYTTNAGGATHTLVLAQTELGDRLAPSLLLVDLAASGVEVTGFYPKLGTLAADTGRIVLDTAVAPHALVGPVGSGLLTLLRCLRFERTMISAGVLSVARRALDLAVAFARLRRLGDQRLLDLQAVRHRLAEAQTRLVAVETMLDAVVARTAAGTVTDQDVATLKFLAARTACDVTDDAIQVFGGRGYTSVFPLERMYRDVRLARIGGGTDEVMLEIVASTLDRSDELAERSLASYLEADERV
jgi:alkylation response protein AidB-like acyl-CoA dehydrogenase